MRCTRRTPRSGRSNVYGSDVAVAVVVGSALVAGLAFGWEPLRAGRAALARRGRDARPLRHLAASGGRSSCRRSTSSRRRRSIEYALLAPAIVLLFRRTVDVNRFLLVFVAWAAAAAGWGVLMFFAIVDDPEGPRPGQREVSFLGHQDLGGFTGAALAIGFAAIALGVRRRLAVVAVVAGVLGVIIDASVFVYLGVVLAAIAAALVGRHRRTLTGRSLAALAAILIVVGSGVYVLRGSDVTNYLSFLGISRSPLSAQSGVQTGAQRTMLLWIGWKMFENHPLLGLGFERSNFDYRPYLAEARRRFPNQPAEAFPSPAHRWGVQNCWRRGGRRHGHRRVRPRRLDLCDRLVLALRRARAGSFRRARRRRLHPRRGRNLERDRDRRRHPARRDHLVRPRARRRRAGGST